MPAKSGLTINARTYRQAMQFATPAEKRELDVLLGLRSDFWSPDPRNEPQCKAYECMADVVGFGGAAGGGKTDLAIGKALTQHQVIQFFRREGTELGAIIDRMAEVIGHTDRLSRSYPATWREPSTGVKLVEFGSVPNPGDERKYQGRPKDLLVFDEAANFLESQVRFLMGWVRTVDPSQHTQTLMCFNPPTNAEGRWIVDFFGPWLDPKHPCPADPGELRWFAMVAGVEHEVIDNTPFVLEGEHKVFDFDRDKYEPDQIIEPKSRTFFPSRVADNPYLMGTNYMAQLQALPEPLRSQMLYGDFQAGVKDDEMQVIPTAWVEAAQARWKPKDRKPPMDSMGVDIARGGDDDTVISRRHDNWYDELLAYPGKQTPDGPTTAALVISQRRDSAPIHLDVIGVGASPFDFLTQANQQVHGINVGEKATELDQSGKLGFFNLRSQLWWKFREELDPQNNKAIALPPDKRLRAELCAPRWELVGKNIKVEDRAKLIKRLGRSADYASAVILARLDTPKLRDLATVSPREQQRGHDPMGIFEPDTGGVQGENSLGHNPFENL